MQRATPHSKSKRRSLSLSLFIFGIAAVNICWGLQPLGLELRPHGKRAPCWHPPVGACGGYMHMYIHNTCMHIYIQTHIYVYIHMYMWAPLPTAPTRRPRRRPRGGHPRRAPPTAPPLQPLRGRRLPRLGRGSLQQQRLALTASPRFPLPKQMLPFLWQFFATKAFENSTCTL